jgi:hypothetical protein
MSHYLDQGLERWIYRTSHENHWRVPSWYSVQDLINEGFACYQKCANRYGRLQRKKQPSKEDRKNFMALVRTTFMRRITDLANERTELPDRLVISQITGPEQTTGDWIDRNGVAEQATQDLRLLIQQAPPELMRLFIALLTDAREARFVKGKCGEHVWRETSNERLCRLYFGKRGRRHAKTVDMLSEIQHYFEHGEWRLKPQRSKAPAVC